MLVRSLIAYIVAAFCVCNTMIIYAFVKNDAPFSYGLPALGVCSWYLLLFLIPLIIQMLVCTFKKNEAMTALLFSSGTLSILLLFFQTNSVCAREPFTARCMSSVLYDLTNVDDSFLGLFFMHLCGVIAWSIVFRRKIVSK
jgi:hypothetical protein